MTGLLDLAARCEAAEGPDRELSAAIALAVHDWLHEVDGNKPLNCRLRNKGGSPVYIGGVSTHMDYTASLDAAMGLVPEGWEVAIYYAHSTTAKLNANVQMETEEMRQQAPFFPIDATAVTPALALCAASLRARSAQP